MHKDKQNPEQLFDGEKVAFLFSRNQEKQVITGGPSYDKVLDTLVLVVERERRSIDVEEVVVGKRRKGMPKIKVSTLECHAEYKARKSKRSQK